MKTITGNLLDIAEGTILHQVNVRGVTGGLAGALHRQHPTAFTDYFLLCDKYGINNLGTVHEGHASRNLSIVHLFGQVDPGPRTNPDAVWKALKSLRGRSLLAPIYAPYKMGCGLGGGNWENYSRYLLTFLPNIIILQRPEDAP